MQGAPFFVAVGLVDMAVEKCGETTISRGRRGWFFRFMSVGI